MHSPAWQMLPFVYSLVEKNFLALGHISSENGNAHLHVKTKKVLLKLMMLLYDAFKYAINLCQLFSTGKDKQKIILSHWLNDTYVTEI